MNIYLNKIVPHFWFFGTDTLLYDLLVAGGLGYLSERLDCPGKSTPGVVGKWQDFALG
jgi:hypothetical protein